MISHISLELNAVLAIPFMNSMHCKDSAWKRREGLTNDWEGINQIERGKEKDIL